MTNEGELSFADIKGRLDEIVEAVNLDDMSLDEALDLYEEAVSLGMRASELIEESEEEVFSGEAESGDVSAQEGE